MSKLIYDRIHLAKKESHNFDKDSLPSIPNGLQSMPKLKLSGSSMNSKNQLGDSGNDPDKENRNMSNLAEKKEKNKKSDFGNMTLKDSTTFSLHNPSGYEPYKEKGRVSNELRNPCASPHFNGGWTNPSSSRNLQAEIRREILQERFTLDNEIDFEKEGIERKVKNNKDRYNRLNFDGLPLNQTLMERPLEAGNVRRSMSLEDLRQGRKAFELDQKLYQEEPRDYTFSFNSRRPLGTGKLSHGNVFHEGAQQESVKGNFTTNLDAYIHYFDKNQELGSRNSKNSRRGENAEGNQTEHCKVHVKQLKTAYAEIGFLKEQIEKLKHKKNELISTNTLLLREVSYNQVREKNFKQKVQLIQAQNICLRQEVKRYKNKLRDAQLLIEEERINNENHLIFLKEILSNNISMALEHKLKHHLSSEKEREYKHRHSIKHFFGGSQTHDLRHRRPSPQKYLYSFDEKADGSDLGRYGNVHKRTLEPHVVLKEGLSPWVSLRDISPELAEEEETTEQSEQNEFVERGHWNEEEEHYDEEEEEEKDEENVEDDEKENKETENEVETEGFEEVGQAHSSNTTSLKKDKQIKWLQKKLSELLKGGGDKSSLMQSYSKERPTHHNYSKFRPAVTDKLGYHAKKNYMRYDEGDRRQSHTFGGVLKHDDINNYSFSLHNSE